MNNKQRAMAWEHDMSCIDAELAEQTAKTIAGGIVSGYKKIENAVVSGYKKMEDGVVEGFGQVVDKCVGTLFAREGESIEEAKARLRHEEEV